MINKIEEIILEIEIEVKELNKLKSKLELLKKKPTKKEYTKILEELEMCANRIKLYLSL